MEIKYCPVCGSKLDKILPEEGGRANCPKCGEISVAFLKLGE